LGALPVRLQLVLNRDETLHTSVDSQIPFSTCLMDAWPRHALLPRPVRATLDLRLGPDDGSSSGTPPPTQ
jgi:hypothetical protein